MRSLITVSCLVLLPAVAGADRIRLDNGKSFDDVVVLKQTADRIDFRVHSGEMSLPLSWVVEVEKTRGALEEYLERKEALDRKAGSAVEWIDLARWARARDVRHGFREALLMAGELDPELEGLPALMASIDYYFEAELRTWSRGRPAAPQAATRRAAKAAVDDSASDPWGSSDVAQGLTRAIERLAEAELERTRERRAHATKPRARVTTFSTIGRVAYGAIGVPLGYAGSGWVFRGEPLRPPHSDPDNPIVRQPRNAQARALLARPPGSLLPVSAYQ